jgi:hypothetical protein
MRTDLQLAQRRATLEREIADLVQRLRAIGTATTTVQRRSQTMLLKRLRRHEAELARMAAGDRSSTSKHAAGKLA